MTAASEFRASVLQCLHHQDAAEMVSNLPTEIFESTLCAMTAIQLADTLPWMDEVDLCCAVLVPEVPILRLAYSMLSARVRDHLNGKVSMTLWRDRIKVSDSDIKDRISKLFQGGKGSYRWIWDGMDRETKARVSLVLTDEQIDKLREGLKL